jgi:glycosyltransferase involved in cell wall biosynthesis
MKISIIIPILNEADSIAQVLAEIPPGLAGEILVIDGGSKDGSAEIAQAAGAKVVHEWRRGYGQACATGSKMAGGDILVFLDGDGADDPQQLPDLVALLQNNTADLVLGSRLAGQIQAGAMPWHQRLGNRLAAGLINLFYRQALTDLSPMRTVRRVDLQALHLQEMAYGWPTEMIVKAARRGWRIAEVPVNYRHRCGGKSKISGTLRGSVLATYFILSTIIRHVWRGE